MNLEIQSKQTNALMGRTDVAFSASYDAGIPSRKDVRAALSAALSIPAESFSHLLVRGFYALKDTWTPIFVAIPGLGLIWLLSTLLIPSLGLNALALSYAIVAILKVAILWPLLSRRLKTI